MGQQRSPGGLRGVTGAHTHGDVRRGDARGLRGLSDADQWCTEVALHVHTQGLERGNVEHRGVLLGVIVGGARDELINGPQEGREGLTRSGGGDHQGVAARRDGLPRAALGGGGPVERGVEPGGRRG